MKYELTYWCTMLMSWKSENAQLVLNGDSQHVLPWPYAVQQYRKPIALCTFIQYDKRCPGPSSLTYAGKMAVIQTPSASAVE